MASNTSRVRAYTCVHARVYVHTRVLRVPAFLSLVILRTTIIATFPSLYEDNEEDAGTDPRFRARRMGFNGRGRGKYVLDSWLFKGRILRKRVGYLRARFGFAIARLGNRSLND